MNDLPKMEKRLTEMGLSDILELLPPVRELDDVEKAEMIMRGHCPKCLAWPTPPHGHRHFGWCVEFTGYTKGVTNDHICKVEWAAYHASIDYPIDDNILISKLDK